MRIFILFFWGGSGNGMVVCVREWMYREFDNGQGWGDVADIFQNRLQCEFCVSGFCDYECVIYGDVSKKVDVMMNR